MKYEDVIQMAQAQDAGPHPGPDFMALMNEVGASAGRSPSRRWLWLGSGLAVAAAAAVAVLWLGPGQTLDRTPGFEPSGEQAQMRARVGSDFREAVDRHRSARHDARPRVRVEAPVVAEEGDTDGRPETEAPLERPSAEELYRRAEEHMRGGKLGRARGELRQILRGYPKYPHRGDVVADLARLEERLGRPGRAACYYHRLATEFAAHPLAAEARKARTRLVEQGDADLQRCKKR